jgi:hypothetical protein
MSYQKGSACIPSHSFPVVRKGCHSEETFLMPVTRIEIGAIGRLELRYRSWLRFLFVQMRESVSLVLAKSDSVQAPLPPPVQVVNVSWVDQGDTSVLSKSQILSWLERSVTRSDCSSTIPRNSYLLSAGPTQML